MTDLAADFLSLPPEYQTVIRLAQERHSIQITPLQALAGGWSGAMVYLVSVLSASPQRIEHLVLKLDRKGEHATADETQRHAAAARLAPPEFAAQHLARLAFERVEAEGALAIFYAVAGQSLHRYRTLAAYERQDQIETIFAATYENVLSGWNAARTFKQAVPPTALLEQWLAFRLKPGNHIEKFMQGVLNFSPDLSGFLIQGGIFPNPLAYARHPEWWGAARPMDAAFGLQHGDLNTGNILVKFAPDEQTLAGYYLIDFALFREQMPLLLDLRYLEMSYLVLRQAHSAPARLIDLIVRLGEADRLEPQRLPVDVAGVGALIGSARQVFDRWVEANHPSLHDDLWGQYWLAGVAAGLAYCHKPALGPAERLTGLVYAAANMKRYAELFHVPTPGEGRQLYTDLAHLGQTGPSGASSPAGGSPLSATPNNLPTQLTQFIGRESELAALKGLLAIAHNRLVTLVAPGGMGKTRLALEAAEQLQAAYPHGVYFVALDRISAAELVAAAVAVAVAEVLPISLASQEDPQARVIDYLRDKHVLLVLDNFEHVLESASLLPRILAAAPHVQMLVTSRVKLNLSGESTVMLQGLSVDEGALEKNSAAQLFAQSAQRTQPQFELAGAGLPAVRRSCGLVEGMPLAIVLAAAWLDTLSVDEIAAEIEKSIDILETEKRDVAARQRSVRAVIESSWGQVDAAAQDLLRRLSVFRGGITRAAAQAAAGATLRGLAQLVDKALLRREPESGRYHIHELVRQYAAEQLAQAPELERAAHAAHAQYFADFMTTGEQRVRDQRQKAALLEIEADFDNIRAAWNHWLARQDAGRLLQFIPALWIYFEVRGSFTPAIQLFGEAAAALTPGDPARVCAQAELRAYQAWFTALVGQPEQGLRLALASLDTMRQNGQSDISVTTLQCVNINAIFLNQTETVIQTTAAMLARAESSGYIWERGRALVWQAYALVIQQQVEQALQAGQEALAIFEQLGNPFDLSVSTGLILGSIYLAAGDVPTARGLFQRGLQAAQDVQYQRLLQICYDNLGTTALLDHDVDQAEQYFLNSLRISQKSGQTREMLASLRDFAKVCLARGDLEGALRLAAVVLHHPASEQNSLNRPERLRDETEKLRAQIETQLDAGRYRAAWETGQRRPLAEVVARLMS